MTRKPNVPPPLVAKSRIAAAHVRTAVQAAQAKLIARPATPGIPPPVQAASLPVPRALAPHVKAATAAAQAARPPHPPRPLPPASRPPAVQAAPARTSRIPRVAATKSVIQRRKIPMDELNEMIRLLGPPGEKDSLDKYRDDVLTVLNASLRGAVHRASRQGPGEGLDEEDRKSLENFMKRLDFDGVFTIELRHRDALFHASRKEWIKQEVAPPSVVATSAAVEAKTLPALEVKTSPAWLAESKEPMHSTLYVHNGRRWNASDTATDTTSGHVEQKAYTSLLANAANATMKDSYKKSWVGFVQNAPPCPEECRAFFSARSSKVPGFIFYVIGDHGGYCRNYDIAIRAPFYLYFHNGSMTRVRPTLAPPTGPP